VTPAYVATGTGRETIVLLHGLGGSHEVWQPQMGAFPGLRTLAWDMPGYGQSASLPEMTFTALGHALEALLNELGIRNVHLVGHSMGGMVALEYAATHPDRIASLALSATSAAFGTSNGTWQRQFVSARLAPLDAGQTMADLAPSLVAGMIGESADPAGVAIAEQIMSAVPEDTYRAAIACLVGFDKRAALAAIQAPTLLIAGSSDKVAPPAMMERMAARMPSARYRVIENAGHLMNLEQPAAFNAALAAFYRDLKIGQNG